MKICPQCKKVYADNLNFCLDDGAALAAQPPADAHRTLSYGDNPTDRFEDPRPTGGTPFTIQQNQTSYGREHRKKSPAPLLFAAAGIAALVGLTLAVVVGTVLLNRRSGTGPVWVQKSPTPTPKTNFTPYRPPTPEKETELKVEILEKVTADMGGKYLKTRITNTSEKIVQTPFIKLSFYKGDVKIKDVSGRSDLPYLKPGQSIPVWLGLYGTDNYTTVKVDGPVTARPAAKTEAQIFPQLDFTETKMKAEKEGVLYNFRQLYKMYYKVTGIVENRTAAAVSPKIFVLYRDDKGEIVGIKDTRLSDLKLDEKTQFEVSESEMDLFGTPKTFEIIAVTD
jgi:hypothetical protein